MALKMGFPIGCLGDPVSCVSNSWFWLGLWSQGGEIKPCVKLSTGCGACLRFSLSPSVPTLPLPCSCTCALSLSQGKIGFLSFLVSRWLSLASIIFPSWLSSLILCVIDSHLRSLVNMVNCCLWCIFASLNWSSHCLMCRCLQEIIAISEDKSKSLVLCSFTCWHLCSLGSHTHTNRPI